MDVFPWMQAHQVIFSLCPGRRRDLYLILNLLCCSKKLPSSGCSLCHHYLLHGPTRRLDDPADHHLPCGLKQCPEFTPLRPQLAKIWLLIRRWTRKVCWIRSTKIQLWPLVHFKSLRKNCISDTRPPDLPLENLYAGQEATVRTGHGTTDWFQIRKEVCQGFYCHPAYLIYMQSIS